MAVSIVILVYEITNGGFTVLKFHLIGCSKTLNLILKFAIFVKIVLQMITQGNVLLLSFSLAVVNEINEKMTIFFKLIVIRQHVRKNAHHYGLRAKTLLNLKRFVNQKLSTIMLCVVLVKASFQRVTPMEIINDFEKIPYHVL